MDSIDELLDEVSMAIAKHRPAESDASLNKTLKKPVNKNFKPNMRNKLDLHLLKQFDASDKLNELSVAMPDRELVTSGRDIKDFAVLTPSNLAEDKTLKQSWKHETIIKDLVDEIDTKLNEKYVYCYID